MTAGGTGSGSRSPFAGVSLRDAIVRLTRAFEAEGIEEPARDARRLALGALNLSSADLLRSPDTVFDSDAAARLSACAVRRLAHEPVSRILGERGFYGRTFTVTPATLDPRPCTETVIDAVLGVADKEGWRDAPIRILDVGTGSGAILLTLLAELPHATGVGTDVSDQALAAARANAMRLGVMKRAEFLNRSMLDDVSGPFDVVVSNPPYIPTADIAGLDPEVRLYDPIGALDGGADGLEFYRALADGLGRVAPSGWGFFEVGAGQAGDVANLFSQDGGGRPRAVEMWPDLGGHLRCVAVGPQRSP